jgi:DNA polymerase III delta subunit
MHYLILGEDKRRKDEEINSLKKGLLFSSDAQKFDCDALYAHKLSPEELKRSLMSLPAISRQRLVIIREGEELKQQHKEMLSEFFESDQKTTVVILEAELSASDKFVQKISGYAQIKEFAVAQGENVFAVTRMMMSRKHTEALTILHEIMDAGQHPLQIMRGLVWFWGNKARARLTQDRFEKGLLCLQEADLNIKRSKLAPDYALEILLAKLCVLLDGA